MLLMYLFCGGKGKGKGKEERDGMRVHIEELG